MFPSEFEPVDIQANTRNRASHNALQIPQPWNGRDIVPLKPKIPKKFTFVNFDLNNDHLINMPQSPKKLVNLDEEGKEAEVDQIAKTILPVLKVEEEGFIDPTKDIVEMTQQGFEITENLKYEAKNITVLDLSSIRLLNPQILTILNCFRNLRHLTMPGALKPIYDDLDESEKRQLQKFGTKAAQNFTQDFNKIIESIADLENLTHLNMTNWMTGLNRCELFTDNNLSMLFRSRKLQYLSIEGCHDMIYRWAQYVVFCDYLKHLDFSGSLIINDSNLEYIARLKFLTHLDISDNLSISDRGLVHVGRILTLEHLNLRGLNRITGYGIERISNCHNLKHLDLARCCNVYRSLSQLAKFTDLEYLDISDVDIDNIELKFLSPLKNLKILKLTNTRVDYNGIDLIKREIPDLRVVS